MKLEAWDDQQIEIKIIKYTDEFKILNKKKIPIKNNIAVTKIQTLSLEHLGFCFKIITSIDACEYDISIFVLYVC